MKTITLSVCLAMMIAIIACKNQASSSSSVVQTKSSLINVKEAQTLIAADKVTVLDVRTPKEISEGKITGALEIDYKADGFKEKIADLDKSKPYLVYCRSGGRSGKTSKLMQKLGFSQTYDLDGGYTAWIEAMENK